MFPFELTRIWNLRISAIIAAFLLVLLFLFARETFWVRRRGGTNGNAPSPTLDMEEQRAVPASDQGEAYTEKLQRQPELTFTQTLRPWNGTLRNGRWLKLSFAPAYLLAAPTVMWSAGTYAFSMGWLVVMADSAGYIFQDPDGYGFTPMQNGLLYFSPLIGSILGGAAGGKVSDLVACVRAYRNDGLYEPEFRLLMTIPATIATVVGLVSFGWSVELHYHWAVPTVFYGLVFFGCTINAMTAVTYCIDCHKPAANHALVVLNMAKGELPCCARLCVCLFIIYVKRLTRLSLGRCPWLDFCPFHGRLAGSFWGA